MAILIYALRVSASLRGWIAKVSAGRAGAAATSEVARLEGLTLNRDEGLSLGHHSTGGARRREALKRGANHWAVQAKLGDKGHVIPHKEIHAPPLAIEQTRCTGGTGETGLAS